MTGTRCPASLEASDFVDGPPRSATDFRLVIGSDGGFHEDRRKLKAVPVDVAVNCCHGGPGEDGALQAALDLAGVTYTGPSAAAAALAMDKAATHAIGLAAGLPVADQALLGPATTVDFEGPYIVKPRFGGSSIGIEVVDDLATAQALLASSRHLRDGAVIERHLTGWVDLNIAARAYPRARAVGHRATPAQAGRLDLHLRREVPERLGRGHGARPPGAAGPAARGGGRRHPPGRPHPRSPRPASGAWPASTSCGTAPTGWCSTRSTPSPGPWPCTCGRPGGETKLATVTRMIDEARARPARQWSSAGADGTALRSAGAIAAKLS